ncbi:hypothetical protein IFM89_002183 [Coptis chinensis]|uniref:F-box domain-containing protein n=1 Tax=Coptis chinensis TaxID=261450 RepID=A0A835I9D3_9MAGN|nr:hypothetical protein IFM89_002183 [Coptis chinensis]
MTQLETSTRSSHNVLHGMMVGVFLNGNLHWLASKKPEVSDSVIILAFDVSTEEFQEIQLPLIANREEKVSKKFEGCLRLTNCDDQWKFNEYKEMYMMKNITKYYKAMRLRDEGRSIGRQLINGSEVEKQEDQQQLELAIDGNLPGDVLLEILSKVPLQWLSRFRWVCKSWCYAISHPRFIKMHYLNTVQKRWPSVLYFWYISGNQDSYLVDHQVFENCQLSVTARRLRFPGFSQYLNKKRRGIRYVCGFC